MLPPRPISIWSMLPVAAAVAWLLVRLPFLSVGSWQRAQERPGMPSLWTAARAAATAPRSVLIEAAMGVTPEFEQVIHDRLGVDGRLIAYAPYGSSDPQQELFWEKVVRDQWERLHNLFYPRPRDCTFARTAADLQRQLEPGLVGKLIVVDGTQEGGELPVVAEFELLLEQRRGPLVRLWLLRGLKR